MAKTRPAADAFKIAGTKSAAPAKTAVKPATEATPEVAQDVAAPRVTAKTQKRQANGETRRSVTAYLPLDLYKDLRAEAFSKDCSMTNIIIEALENQLHR